MSRLARSLGKWGMESRLLSMVSSSKVASKFSPRAGKMFGSNSASQYLGKESRGSGKSILSRATKSARPLNLLRETDTSWNLDDSGHCASKKGWDSAEYKWGLLGSCLRTHSFWNVNGPASHLILCLAMLEFLKMNQLHRVASQTYYGLICHLRPKDQAKVYLCPARKIKCLPEGFVIY